MIINSINITKTVSEGQNLLDKEDSLPSSTHDMIQNLLMIIKLLCDRLNLNSTNSGKPPSSDPNRDKFPKNREKSSKPPGGQKGHKGNTLSPIENPDIIKEIPIDKTTLPSGNYREDGFQARQVVNIKITREVVEFRAQVLVDKYNRRFVAPFPSGVDREIQYGSSVKSHSVYLSNFQLIPYGRVQTQFHNKYGINLSPGSIYNFNCQASKRLKENFEKAAKYALSNSSRLNGDETSINVDGKRKWLHCASNDLWTWLYPHNKRGSEAMNDIGILPEFKGVLCHDHWKAYYIYDCLHSLCNAHHLRELMRAWEQDGQVWAKSMHYLLKEINIDVHESGEELDPKKAKYWRDKYLDILEEGENECPPPSPKKSKNGKKKKGRVKRSKARNLLERLLKYEEDVLRFMENADVPFTNNSAERDQRMSKVQQKISGCFRSMEAAKDHFIIRSYLSTCRKHEMNAAEALDLLFQGKIPDFIQKMMDKIDALKSTS